MLNYLTKKYLNRKNKIAIDKRLLSDVLDRLKDTHKLYAIKQRNPFKTKILSNQKVSQFTSIEIKPKDTKQVLNGSVIEKINKLFKENK